MENLCPRPSGQGLGQGQEFLGVAGLEVYPQFMAYDVRMCDVRVSSSPPPPTSNAPPPLPCPGPPHNLLAPTRTTAATAAAGGHSDMDTAFQVQVPVPPPPPTAAATTSSSSSIVGCLFASSKATKTAPAMVHRLLLRRVKCVTDGDDGVGGDALGGGGGGACSGSWNSTSTNRNRTITWIATTTTSPSTTSSSAQASTTTSPCTGALRERYQWVAEVVTSSLGHDIQFASPRPTVTYPLTTD